MEGFGQVTYTSNGTCASNFGAYFTTASCWTKTGVCTPAPAIPPTSGTAGCTVIMVINHEINVTDLNIGSLITYKVNSGGKLTLTGNLTKAANSSGAIQVDGGTLQVGGGLTLLSGAQNSKTVSNVDIRNGGSFDVNGGLLDVQNDAILSIDGDGESALNVKTFNFGQRSNVNILLGGGLGVSGDVDYRGNNSAINVYGFFRTGGSVLITGGSGNQLNAFGDAEVIITKNLDVRGTSDITFGGTSETDIGGDIIVSGNSKVIAEDDAKVFVCGNYPPVTTGSCPNNAKACELETGKFNPACRILPVDYLFTEVNYSSQSRISILTWATAKEWENSHFEIERSVSDIEGFEKVGEVQGMGWKDSVTEYEFEDKALPISEGTVYYRLKQVDFNGDFAYSKVMSIRTSGLELTKGVWRAFPNPTTGDDFRLDILNATEYKGEIVQVKLISPASGSKTITGSDMGEISNGLSEMIQQSSNGFYILEIFWGNRLEHIKILKK
ncbi:hypothetical protein BH23BAC2_BH23BAC2_26950 [soil metagenome]